MNNSTIYELVTHFLKTTRYQLVIMTLKMLLETLPVLPFNAFDMFYFIWNRASVTQNLDYGIVQ